jgi:polyhydroxybutyrate depolymerase
VQHSKRPLPLVVGGAVLSVAIATLGAQPLARASDGCASPPVAGSHALQLDVGGTVRTALVHVPPGVAAGQPLALVLALHGYGGSGPRMEPYSGFSAVADRYGLLVAYPSSEGLSWNSTAARGHPDDVRFLARLIDLLSATMCVDSRRVYATGVSNGGSMVALAACALSSRIAAVAPLAGDYTRQPPCRPARPVSVLEIHGTADQIVPYFGRGTRRTADGMPPVVNQWVRLDRCPPRPRSGMLAPRARWFAWSGCAGAVRVEHVRISGGRHQWPGATPPDPGPPSTFCGVCTIWKFFSAVGAGPRMWGAR